MDSDDLYETNSQIGNNIYPTTNNINTNSYITNYKDATIIDDTILDTKSYAEPYKQIMYKKNIKSHVYNPQTGNYNEVITSEPISGDINNNSDISIRTNSVNFGSYTNNLKPPQNKAKWKKLTTIPENKAHISCENNFCICPICNTSAVSVCNCVNRDSICKNNHTWHIKNNNRLLGHTHSMNPQVNNSNRLHNNQLNNNNGCVIM
jgi:hypothetical protein